VRDEQDLSHHIAYVLQNPLAAGLIDWPWVGRGTAPPASVSQSNNAPPASVSQSNTALPGGVSESATALPGGVGAFASPTAINGADKTPQQKPAAK